MEKYLVSIIIPVYNANNYIEECLQSLSNQTYNNIEIIVINDGSTDDSLKICERLAKSDSRIRIIDKPNGGVSSARNEGLKYAQGIFITFCDSDDIMHSKYVELMVEIILKTQSDLACCTYSTDKRSIKVGSNKSINVIKDRELMLLSIVENPKYGGYLWNKIFKKELIEGLWFDESIRICEDKLFCVEYLEKCDSITLVDETLYFYRENNTSALHQKFTNNKLTYVKAKDQIFDILRNSINTSKLIERESQEITYLYSTYFLKVVFSSTLGDGYWEKYLSEGIHKYRQVDIFAFRNFRKMSIVLFSRILVWIKYKELRKKRY